MDVLKENYIFKNTKKNHYHVLKLSQSKIKQQRVPLPTTFAIFMDLNIKALQRTIQPLTRSLFPLDLIKDGIVTRHKIEV